MREIIGYDQDGHTLYSEVVESRGKLRMTSHKEQLRKSDKMAALIKRQEESKRKRAWGLKKSRSRKYQIFKKDA